MKKIISLILCLALTVSVLLLSACSGSGDDNGSTLNGKTPEQTYAAALSAVENATSYKIDVEQNVEMSGSNMKQTIVMISDGEDVYMKISMLGYEMECWYIDGYAYINDGEDKYKTEISAEDFASEYFESAGVGDTLFELPVEAFENLKFKKVEAEYVLEFAVSDALYDSLLSSMGMEGMDINEDEEVVYDVYFDAKGNLTKLETAFTISYMGMTMSCESVANISVTGVTVTPPEDIDSYQIVSAE